MKSSPLVIAGLVIAFAVGCGDSKSTTSSSVAGSVDSTTSTTAKAAGSTGATTTTSTAASTPELAAWQQIELTDTDGSAFTVETLRGKPALVEVMATWCSNCGKQLADTQKAAEMLGDRASVVAVSIETDLSKDDLALYKSQKEFSNIRFAVMSESMLASIKDAFGNPAITPPSTPKIAINADGSVRGMTTGFESPEEVISSLGL